MQKTQSDWLATVAAAAAAAAVLVVAVAVMSLVVEEVVVVVASSVDGWVVLSSIAVVVIASTAAWDVGVAPAKCCACWGWRYGWKRVGLFACRLPIRFEGVGMATGDCNSGFNDGGGSGGDDDKGRESRRDVVDDDNAGDGGDIAGADDVDDVLSASRGPSNSAAMLTMFCSDWTDILSDDSGEYDCI
jgi:hypothetical protein